MTFHATEATTVEDAEAMLVEADASTMYSLGNNVKVEELL
jgi:hypothetical protein